MLVLIKEINQKRQKVVKETDGEGREFGSGSLTVNVFDFDSHAGQGLVHLRYNREYFEKSKIVYKVRKLDVTSAELSAAGSSEDFSFHPLLIELYGTEFILVQGELEVRALYSIPSNDKVILIAYLKSSERTENVPTSQHLTDRVALLTGNIAVYVEKWDRLTKGKPVRVFTEKDVSQMAFDPNKRLLAFWDNEEKVLAVYEFTEEYLSLLPYSQHSLKDKFDGVGISNMQFFNGKNMILLVDSDSRGSVYEI